MVFVAGSTGLVAYDIGPGAKLWDNGADSGRSVAVSPDGHAVSSSSPSAPAAAPGISPRPRSTPRPASSFSPGSAGDVTDRIRPPVDRLVG
jgi:hypothetical protein